jgi:hypothetical protein
MWRTVGSILAGLVAWVMIVTLLNFGLRGLIPGYHAAEATLVFTSAMKAGRLIEAALTSLAAGAVVRLIAPSSRWAPWIAGLILLALFLPEHVKLWNKFPVWYHLTFLVSLVPLFGIGAALMPNAPRREFQPAVSRRSTG